MIKYTEGNVFKDLGFSEKEAYILEFKSKLFITIKEISEKKGLTRRDLEKILDVPQPRVSDLMTGKLDKFSIETLIIFLNTLGASVSPQILVA